MKEKTLQTVFQNRFSSNVLNTSYPLRPSDWFPFRIEGKLPFDNLVPLSFYLHIPFCQHLCKFCEYTRMALPNADRQRQYLAVVSQDINQFIASYPDIVLRGFDIGGGTPTALSDDNFQRLMTIYADTISRVQVSEDFEPSIEGTFLTINSEKLKAIVRAGFRRLSLGIQTSTAAVLDAQGRSVVPLDLMKDILDKAHEAGIQKINLDLMYGLAGQNGVSQQRDFEVIGQLAPEQVTLYELRTNMLHNVQSASKEELYAAYCSYYDALLQMGYHARFGQNTFSRSDKDFGVSSYLRSRMLEGAPYRGTLRVWNIDAGDGNKYLAISFDRFGKLMQPEGEVSITLPDDMKGTTAGIISADGGVQTVQESNGILKLDFTSTPVVVLKGN